MSQQEGTTGHLALTTNYSLHCNLGLLFSDVAPLSAPAFSFCFPLLNAMLRESSGSSEEAEIVMTRALQVIAEHSQLRADTDGDDTAIDEVGIVFFSLADKKNV